MPATRLGKITLGLFAAFVVLLVLVLIFYQMLGYPARGIAGVLGYATVITALLTLVCGLVSIIVREERAISVIVAAVTALIVVGAVVVGFINAWLL
ncbi:MAG TPA: hypothetical protein PK883_06590 [Anaerolineaceae bacterium]|nr:hypothetical protein [Anaerolineaceae bacterium]